MLGNMPLIYTHLAKYTTCLSPTPGKTNMAPNGSVGRPKAHCRHNLLVGRRKFAADVFLETR